jgi:hypothetical protein
MNRQMKRALQNQQTSKNGKELWQHTLIVNYI